MKIKTFALVLVHNLNLRRKTSFLNAIKSDDLFFIHQHDFATKIENLDVD